MKRAKPKLDLLVTPAAIQFAPAPASDSQRGVYIEEIAPPGEHWYKVVLSSGKVGIVHLPDELVDDNTMERLWRELDAKDPAPRPRLSL